MEVTIERRVQSQQYYVMRAYNNLRANKLCLCQISHT